jgi:hypothetical protein
MKHRQAATARAFTIGLTFWLSQCKFESRHGIVRGFVAGITATNSSVWLHLLFATFRTWRLEQVMSVHWVDPKRTFAPLK